MKNNELKKEKRTQYMTGEISHDDFYLWLADLIGVDSNDIPATSEEIKNSTDEHLNDIQLTRWDRMHGLIQYKAFSKHLDWSLSDTVCVLKVYARNRMMGV